MSDARATSCFGLEPRPVEMPYPDVADDDLRITRGLVDGVASSVPLWGAIIISLRLAL
jgi:hypothetical protein